MPFPSTVKINQLEAKCPEFSTHSQEWLNLALLSDAGTALRDSSFLQNILPQRPKEPMAVYISRLAAFTYQPILPSITGWYTSKLFERNPEFNGISTNDFWTGFLANCDRNGMTMEAFGAEMFRTAFLSTATYTLVDLPASGDTPVVDNRADQEASGALQPYLCNFSPSQVTNYTTDRFGALDSIVIRTETVNMPFLEKPSLVTEWRYFDRQEFAVYQAENKSENDYSLTASLFMLDNTKEAKLTGSGRHALASSNKGMGRVPVVRSEMPDALRLTRRAYLQVLDHVNQDNAFKWALFNGCYAVPVITSDADIAALNVGETLWIQLPADAKYGFLEPSGVTFKFAAERLATLRQEIYRSYHLQAQGRDSSASAASSSGYSKELEMAPAKDVLNAYAEWAQSAMGNVLKLVAEARGEDSTAISVRMPQQDQAITMSEIETGEALDTLDIQSDTLYMVRDKKVALSYMQDQPEDDVKKVIAEIETAPPKSVRAEQQRQAQVLQFQQSLSKASDHAAAHEELVAQDAAA